MDLEYDRNFTFPFRGASFGQNFQGAFFAVRFILWWFSGVLKIQAEHLVDHHHLGSPWHYRHEI